MMDTSRKQALAKPAECITCGMKPMMTFEEMTEHDYTLGHLVLFTRRDGSTFTTKTKAVGVR